MRISTSVFLALSFSGAVIAQGIPAPGTVLQQQEQREQLERSRETNLPGTEVFSIPPVVERPEEVTGPRVRVSTFELYLLRAKFPADIVASLDEYLRERVANQPAEGYSVSELQEVADGVTNRMRSAGYVVARAYVPVQQVSGGVVNIQVLEGRLGRVLAEDNKHYSVERLARPFDGMYGEPIELAQLETAVLTLTDYPGLTPFSVLAPGEHVGETDITVQVRDERKVDFQVSTDNYGETHTGEMELIGELRWHNLSGAADEFVATLLQTGDPTNSTYGSVYYRRPIFTSHLAIGADYEHNRFDVGRELADQGLSGEADIGSLFLDHAFIRTRAHNLYGKLDLALKDATSEQEAFGGITARDELTVFGAELSYDKADHVAGAFAGVNQGAVYWHHGFNDLLGSMDEFGNASGGVSSSRIGADGTHAAGQFDTYAFRFSRLQRLGKTNALLLRMFGQYTNDLLTALEQVSLGGPYNVRAYPVSTALVDKGGFATLEWIIHAPGFADRPVGQTTWGQIFTVSVFYDYAGGKVIDPLFGEEESVDLSGYGIGLEFRLTNKFLLRLDTAKARNPNRPVDDPQYYAMFSYTF